jgi:outer membrane protein assembly factor BamB
MTPLTTTSLLRARFSRTPHRDSFLRSFTCVACAAFLLASCGKRDSASPVPTRAGAHLKWQFKSTGSAISHPALSPDGTIYIGTSRALQAVSPNGKLLWDTNLNAPGTPVISDDGTIYLGLRYGIMFGISKDGKLVWRPGYGLIGFAAPPALGAETTLYYMNTSADIYAFQPKHDEKLWSLDTFREGMLGASPVLPGTAKADGLARNAPLLTRNGSVILPRQNFLHSISADGAPQWELELTPDSLGQAALADDGTIYVSDGGHVFAVDPSGSVKWQFEAGWLGSAVIDTDGVLYFSNGTAVYAVNPDGNLKWKFSPQPRVNLLTSPALAADGTLYIGGEFAFIAIRPDGTLKWNLRLPSPTSSATIAPDGTIYFACGYSALCAVEDAGSPLMHSSWPKQFHDLANTSNILHGWN